MRRGASSRPGVAAPVLRAAWLVALFATVAVFFAWSRTRAQRSAYELGEHRQAHERLVRERDRLRLEVETLRAPGALEGPARRLLGMAPPAPGTVLVAGPRLAAGRAGVDGGGHRSGSAEPPSLSGRRAGPAAPGATRVALRGTPRAGPGGGPEE